MFNAILNNIGRQVKLTDEEAGEFCSFLSIRTVKRKEFLVREGQICYYESYINKGCFRNYIVDNQGLEHNFYFSKEDWWVSDIHSRTFRVPSFSNVVAVEDSELIQITQVDLDHVMSKISKIEHFFRLAYQKSMAIHQLQLLHQLHMTAEERYIAFRAKYPDFDKRIPQKHIATYLGLTPEFFNIIRSRVIKES